MTPDESQRSTAPTRRELRTGSTGGIEVPADAAEGGGTATLTEPRPSVVEGTPTVEAAARPAALGWLADDAVSAKPASAPETDAPLVARWPRRSALRAPLLVPLITAGVLATVYGVAMLVWPLHSVTPSIAAAELAPAPAAAAEMPWPAQGAAAVSVAGLPDAAASSVDALSMASITKVVACLVVLEEMPLALGEQGPSFYFGFQTSWQYLEQNESALPVPVGGSLTQYQLLEGTLLGSAGNYIDRLAYSLYPNDAVYARAAMDWLSAHGISGITIADPSGISPANTATPDGLLALAQRAMAHPVIAEIVGKTSVEIPGAGAVANSNALLVDPGVVGVKTGMLDGDYNVLLAKDIPVGETTVRVYADVLHQPDSDTRWAVARALFASMEEQLQPASVVPRGTVVGSVTTAWGEPVDVVTATDAAVIMWNGSTATAATTLALGEARTRGTDVGSVSVKGELDSVDVAAELASDVDGPSPWWRLTHPLELLGLSG